MEINLMINSDTLGKDIVAQQDAYKIVREVWGATPDDSVAESLCERVIARITQKLDIMAVIAINRIEF